MQAAEELSSTSGTLPACRALGVVRATLYRHRRRWLGVPIEARCKRGHPRALGTQEQHAVLAELRSARFVDQAPAAVYAGLLDEGRYLCSECQWQSENPQLWQLKTPHPLTTEVKSATENGR